VNEPQQITITPPNLQELHLRIVGVAPYMQARFSEKARQAMMAKQAAGSVAKKGAKREPRDFDADFRAAQHRASEGWVGIPASAIRNACIDACRMVGFQMTRAKMSVFIEPDGFDVLDGTPLVRLDAGEPERTEMTTRNATGVPDIRIRPQGEGEYVPAVVLARQPARWQLARDEVLRYLDAAQDAVADLDEVLRVYGPHVRPIARATRAIQEARSEVEAITT